MADCFSLPNAAELVEQLRSASKLGDAPSFDKFGVLVSKSTAQQSADIIEALLSENAKLESKIDRLKVERDTAVADLKKIGCCETCEQCTMQDGTDCWCAATNDWNEWSDTCPCWEWRGVKEEEDG